MAIVEDKRGMQIGNMPSVDAVSQEGFIIYSDDGIHTYKMTIAEFAQAIGVVMTGGGDGDGEGEGLAYWIEDARRIYRDLMMSNENEFRTIMQQGVLGHTDISQVFRTGIHPNYSATTEDGYSASRGTGIHWYYDSGITYRIFPDRVEHDILKTYRFPSLNSSLEMPDSKYYCNLTPASQRPVVQYSYVGSEFNFPDIVVNPNMKFSDEVYDYSGSDPVAMGIRAFDYPRIDAPGQDRRFFGYINLNVNRTVKVHNPRQVANNEFSGPSMESLEQQLRVHQESAQFVDDDYPVTGTAEYLFSLYCIGNPYEKVKATYSKYNKLEEFEYYPFTLGNRLRVTGMQSHRYYYNLDETKYVENLEEMPDLPYHSSGDVAILDKRTGMGNLSPYTRAIELVEHQDTPEEYDWTEGIKNWDDNLNGYYSWPRYNDKSDIGGAYFTDDEGTLWYIALVPRTRASRSFWDEANGVEPTIISSDPTDFDKAPSFLDIGQVFDHWCYDGNDSLEDNYDHTIAAWDGEAWTTETGGVTTYHRKFIPEKYSLKQEMMDLYYERIQNIGKAVLSSLGLKGITPVELEAAGMHSEISATVDSVLNGGRYLNNNTYEQTYNLDGVSGSLYLKGDVYDNGKKASDKFQEKLTPGENITIERDENDDLVISSTGGGSSSELEYEFDSSTKQTTISGLGDKDIHLSKYNGIYLNPSYGQRSGKKWIELQPKVDVGSMNSTIEGLPMSSTDPADSANKLYLDIKETYRNNTQRRLTGGKHVWLNNQPNTDGNTPSGSGTTSVRDTLYTDCIDTIKVDGVALTTQLDAQTGSHFVDIPSSGGGAAGNPFTIVDNYGGSSYVDSASNYYTNLGSLIIPNKNSYDGYLWVQAEAAIQITSSDTIAADSIISLEMRPDGFYNDLVSRISNEGYDHRSMILVDAKQIVHVDDNNIWTKVSICGMLNHTLSSPPSLNINVLQNSGIRKQVYWKAGIAYIPRSS